MSSNWGDRGTQCWDVGVVITDERDVISGDYSLNVCYFKRFLHALFLLNVLISVLSYNWLVINFKCMISVALRCCE